MTARGKSKAPVQLNVFGNVCTLFVNGLTTRTLYPNDELLGAAALALRGEVMGVGDFLQVHFRFPFCLRKIPGVFVMFRMRFDLGFFCPLTELGGSEKQ